MLVGIYICENVIKGTGSVLSISTFRFKRNSCLCQKLMSLRTNWRFFIVTSGRTPGSHSSGAEFFVVDGSPPANRLVFIVGV
jgi:hypothetical protein